MKRIFTLILALSLLALTACSGGGTGETDSLTPEAVSYTHLPPQSRTSAISATAWLSPWIP